MLSQLVGENLGVVDNGADALHQCGWSYGDLSFVEGHRLVWQVHAHRGDQRIVARAPTQVEAWAAALDQARGLEQN